MIAAISKDTNDQIAVFAATSFAFSAFSKANFLASSSLTFGQPNFHLTKISNKNPNLSIYMIDRQQLYS